jgi:hypothetical protein
VTLLVDTREPDPHPWESHIRPGWNFERGTLETGDIAPLSPEASETANPSPLTPPVPELARVALAQVAELRRQRDFRTDSNHLGSAYTAHHILQCASREDFVMPGGIDCGAADHFVEAVFEGATRLFRERA